MAIKGMTIYKTLDWNIADNISKYIWSLSFVKPLRVDVAVYDDATEIEAYVSRVRYAVKVNPNVKLEEVKQFLLNKGYIVED